MVYKNVHRECRCHGLSAGCATKTCTHVLPDRAIISAIILSKYKSAVKVTFSLKATTSSNGGMVPVNKKDDIDSNVMVFMDESVNFCYKDISRGSFGVKGNRCNANKHGEYGQCVDVCCGRGFVEVERTYTEEECEFIWCCKLKCKDHIKKERVYVCS